MVIDTVADILARIQNGIIAQKEEITSPVTKLSGEILRVLRQEKMISDFSEVDGNYVIVLKYREGDEPEIQNLTKISKPGQRMYVTAKEIKPVMNGRGISIISTSSGIMSGAQAKARGLGGELICEVW